MNFRSVPVKEEPVSRSYTKQNGCCNKDLIFEKKDVSVYQAKCIVCGTHYQQKDGSQLLYKTVNQGEDWNCTVCGSEIQGAEIKHSIHDGPFPLSGSGKVYTEFVPYCPKCEQKPTRGTFI